MVVLPGNFKLPIVNVKIPRDPNCLPPPLVQRRFLCFLFRQLEEHDAEANSGTFGSADEQAELQCSNNICDVE